MSRLRTITVVLALGGVFAIGAPAADLAPTLNARSLAPLSVRGAHFQPGERVRLRLEAGVPHVVRVRATAGGAFVAVFPGVSVERCDGFVVTAAGSKGSKAVLRPRQLMCASTNPG